MGSRDGYWTAEKFLKQVREAFDIPEYRYPREEGLYIGCVLCFQRILTQIGNFYFFANVL